MEMTFKIYKIIAIQHIIDTTIINFDNSVLNSMPQGLIKCNDRIINDKDSNFGNLSKSKTSTTDTRATTLPPIENAFMCIETSSNNNAGEKFVSFEGIDIFQINTITSYYNRFSLNIDSTLKTKDRLRTRFLIDGSWHI